MIRGVKTLRAGDLLASDLRGGAALAVAALSAEGESLIRGLEHVERGYEDMAAALTALGAAAERLEE